MTGASWATPCTASAVHISDDGMLVTKISGPFVTHVTTKRLERQEGVA